MSTKQIVKMILISILSISVLASIAYFTQSYTIYNELNFNKEDSFILTLIGSIIIISCTGFFVMSLKFYKLQSKVDKVMDTLKEILNNQYDFHDNNILSHEVTQYLIGLLKHKGDNDEQ